jgi:hypothetical protein
VTPAVALQVASLCLIAVSCANGPVTPIEASPANALSLQANVWTTISDPSDFRLENDQNGSLAFDFPADPGSMNYLYNTRPPRSIGGVMIVSLRVTTTGAVLFNYMTEPFNTCQTPAHVRPFVWANANASGDNDRWWSNPASYQLAAGSATLTVPLTPGRWSNVNGTFGTSSPAALAAFTAALRNVSSLGLTFGGGCFFGHGINVKGGTARFVLSEYRIE